MRTLLPTNPHPTSTPTRPPPPTQPPTPCSMDNYKNSVLFAEETKA